MKHPILFLSLLFSFSNLFAQLVESKSYDKMLKSLLSHSVPEISVRMAAAMHASVFIDAREKNEFAVSHIHHAYWAGYQNFEISQTYSIPKNTPIIVYCSVGYRSEKIAEQLIAAGFKNVSNLYGGIFEWKNQGYLVYDSTGRPTEKVHAYTRSWGIWLNNAEKVY